MTAVFALVIIQALLGAFDILFHHEATERLPWRPGAARELALHATRNVLYAVVFASLGWVAWQGALAWAFGAVIAVEIVITLWDFVEEDRTRPLPPGERVLHGILAINYGAFLAVFAPHLWAWAAAPTGFAWQDHGAFGWVMAAFAIGVLPFGLRDALASRRVRRLVARPAAPLAAGLPDGRKVLITGATGFVGARLVEALVAAGHHVTVLTRRADKARTLAQPVTVVTSLDDIPAAATFDAIVNLAGESIAAGRWSAGRRARILRSRVGTTMGLVALIGRLERKPAVLVSASAIGVYGNGGERKLDETAPPRPSFTHEVCAAWEAEAVRAAAFGVRVVALRIGLVLDRDGGALARLLLPFEFGLGGPMGRGGQWMSWIHRDDLVRAICHAIADAELDGPVNAVTTDPVRNAEFAEALGRALGRPAALRLPAAVIRAAFGQMGEELFLASQRVVPARLADRGFVCRYPRIDAALAEITGAPPERRRAGAHAATPRASRQ
ncbi:MAG: TIGR01777 family protein [Rhodospirillaceae bacterium]|nr:TIGR01777 family protein [Rhodospirillaceae bacterium]